MALRPQVLRFAGAQAGGEEAAFGGVVGQGQSVAVFRGGLRITREAAEEVRASGEEVVVGAKRIGVDSLQRGEPGGRTVGEADGNGTVQVDDGRGRDSGKRPVVSDDGAPVGGFPGGGTGVAGGNGGLEMVAARAVGWGEGGRAIEPF